MSEVDLDAIKKGNHGAMNEHLPQTPPTPSARPRRLTNQSEHDSSQVKSFPAPALYSEPDLLIKVVREVFDCGFSRTLIHSKEARETITKYLESVTPDHLEETVTKNNLEAAEQIVRQL
ncbi:hypothetical protein QBC39DRAFT_376933 [Podospora conica]|nr:hypothetical protein QBC39DRAFT_376933 [Schizothecium conicum]